MICLILNVFCRWKYHEVCLLSLGYIQNTIIEKLESGELKDDFKSFLTEFLISSCCGEGMIFLARYNTLSKLIPTAIANEQQHRV